ncbi:MAG: phosphoglycolate phosphatase [Sulfolobaceae archaeon]|nr:phosphoglycolate phosphatase [Sulfolobaceae archaeon]
MYLIAADYDRTLAAEEDRFILKPKVRDAINAFCKDNLFVIVSGRTKKDIEALSEGLEPSAWILENGTLIFYKNDIIRNYPESWSAARKRIIELLNANNIKYSLGEVIIFLGDISNYKEKVIEIINNVDGASIEFNRHDAMILPKDINKGIGLRRFINEIKFNGTIIAVGDGENDLSLFEEANIKVAVNNAIEQLKRRADIVLKNPDGDGILELINMIRKKEI